CVGRIVVHHHIQRLFLSVTDRSSVAVKNVGLAQKAQRQSEGSKYKVLISFKYPGELLSISIIRGQTATVSRHITCSASKWSRGQYSAVQSSIKNTCLASKWGLRSKLSSQKGSTAKHIPDKTRLPELDRTMNLYTWRPAPFLHTGVDTKTKQYNNDKTDPETQTSYFAQIITT